MVDMVDMDMGMAMAEGTGAAADRLMRLPQISRTTIKLTRKPTSNDGGTAGTAGTADTVDTGTDIMADTIAVAGQSINRNNWKIKRRTSSGTIRAGTVMVTVIVAEATTEAIVDIMVDTADTDFPMDFAENWIPLMTHNFPVLNFNFLAFRTITFKVRQLNTKGIPI